MSFRITGLSPEPFQELFGLCAAALAAKGVQRHVVNVKPGFPDRVELRDAEPGDTVLLLNYVHQPANTPYRASHAIYVREGATERYDRVDAVPESFRSRTLSLRAFNDAGEIVDADLVEGQTMGDLIERLLDNPKVAYIQAHYAKYGCYAGRIERAR